MKNLNEESPAGSRAETHAELDGEMVTPVDKGLHTKVLRGEAGNELALEDEINGLGKDRTPKWLHRER